MSLPMGSMWKNGDGLCPECGSEECIGLTNGHGLCACGAEFRLESAQTEAQVVMCAKMATYWRAIARNTERVSGPRSARFEHGCANLWQNMIPPNEATGSQIEAFVHTQEAQDG